MTKKKLAQFLTSFIIFIYISSFSAHHVRAAEVNDVLQLANILRAVITDYTVLCPILAAMGITDCSGSGSSGGDTPNNGRSGGDVPDIKHLVTTEYSLPEPNQDSALRLLSQLQGESAEWATGSLLKAERTCGDKCLRYLTTAWIWSESNPSAYPDPYEINCPKNGSEPSIICTSMNFQIAGYQAGGQAKVGAIRSTFLDLYGPDRYKEVAQKVYDNSKYASREKWKYIADAQKSSDLFKEVGAVDDTGNLVIPAEVNTGTIADHASLDPANSDGNDFWNHKIQFYTLLIGKDPGMVIRLNSAVSKSNLVGRCLENIAQPDYPSNVPGSTPCYGDANYYSKVWAQKLSDHAAALWMFDNNKTDLSPLNSSGGGSIPMDGTKLEQMAAAANIIGDRTEKGTNCDDAGLAWACRNVRPYTQNGYTTDEYLGTSNAQTQMCTDVTRGSVGLADGTDYGLSRATTIQMKDWQNHNWPYYKYYDGNHQQILTDIKPGCAMFQFNTFDANHVPVQYPGTHQHASMVVGVDINPTTGDGTITTRESNAPTSTKVFTVSGWEFVNTYYPYVSFGCR